MPLFNGKDLTGWKLSQFGTQGEAFVKNSQIVLTRSDGCTAIYWTGEFPTNNYELTLDAKRTSGNDFFCSITFPYLEKHCTLIIGGWGNMVVGLSNVNGLDALHNKTYKLGVFNNNQWYRVRLKVEKTKIEAWIDGEKYLDFSTVGHRISIRETMDVTTPFGISAWESVAALKNIHLQY